jgi:hypothetical protein
MIGQRVARVVLVGLLAQPGVALRAQESEPGAVALPIHVGQLVWVTTIDGAEISGRVLSHSPAVCESPPGATARPRCRSHEFSESRSVTD